MALDRNTSILVVLDKDHGFLQRNAGASLCRILVFFHASSCRRLRRFDLLVSNPSSFTSQCCSSVRMVGIPHCSQSDMALSSYLRSVAIQHLPIQKNFADSGIQISRKLHPTTFFGSPSLTDCTCNILGVPRYVIPVPFSLCPTR